jgi:hypothetical protein
MISGLSESIDYLQKSSIGGSRAILGPEMFTKTQRISNSIHSIEIAASEGSLAKMKTLKERIDAAKSALEPLSGHLQDAVVTKTHIDAAQLRQIEGHIRAFKESVIRVQLALI